MIKPTELRYIKKQIPYLSHLKMGSVVTLLQNILDVFHPLPR